MTVERVGDGWMSELWPNAGCLEDPMLTRLFIGGGCSHAGRLSLGWLLVALSKALTCFPLLGSNLPSSSFPCRDW